MKSPTCHSVHKCWVPEHPLPTTALILSYSWCWSSWPRTSQGLERSSGIPSWIPLCGQIGAVFNFHFRETDEYQSLKCLSFDSKALGNVYSAWPWSLYRQILYRYHTTLSSKCVTPGICQMSNSLVLLCCVSHVKETLNIEKARCFSPTVIFVCACTDVCHWLPYHALVLFVPNLNPLLPLLFAEFVLVKNSENIRHESFRNHAGKRVITLRLKGDDINDINCETKIMLKLVLPLREQIFVVQIAWCVDFFVIVCILGLHCIGGQEDGCLWRAVDVVI